MFIDIENCKIVNFVNFATLQNIEQSYFDILFRTYYSADNSWEIATNIRIGSWNDNLSCISTFIAIYQAFEHTNEQFL